MKAKKALAVILTLAMLVVMAACSGTPAATNAPVATTAAPASTPGASDPAQPATEEPEAELGYPIPGGKTLTYWMGVSVSNWNDNNAKLPLYKMLMEKTGVTLEFVHPIVGQDTEGFNLMIAGGEYPDLIESRVMDAGSLFNDGVIIDLTEVLPQYAPNLWGLLQDNPSIDLQVKNDDGQYLLYPFIRPDPLLQISSGPIVRTDWVEALGMDPDKVDTIAEWEDMLRGFKEEMGAEVPLAFDSADNYRRLMYAWETSHDFTNENGTVNYGWLREGYRGWLETMTKWYAEGWLDPNFPSSERAVLNSNILTGKTGATFGSGGSYLGVWLTGIPEDAPEGYDLGGLRYPTLEEGAVGHHGDSVQFEFSNSNGWVMISTQCKDVETAARFLDYGYSEEGIIAYNFGVEGESFEFVGGEPIYTEAMFNNAEMSISDTLGHYVRATGSGPFIQNPGYIMQYYEADQQKVALGRWAAQEFKDTKMPPIVHTPEEGTEVTTIMADINTYIKEEQTKFVTGARSLDTFDDFIATIKSMNIDRAIEIKQNALNRYYER